MPVILPEWRRRKRLIKGNVDPYYDYVVWLLHMEGGNGDTSFVDNSKYNRVSTAYGAAQTSTAQKKFGSTAGSFNGTNSHIRTAATAELQLTGDFTIETFIYTNTNAGMMLASSQATGNTQIFRLNENGAGNLSLYSGSGYVFSAIPAGIVSGAWRHLAFSRTGSITNALVDGSVVATNTTWTGTLRCDAIGSGWLNGGGNWVDGFIDEFRITKGVGRYPTSFNVQTGEHPNF
jgi:hypothetical protein